VVSLPSKGVVSFRLISFRYGRQSGLGLGLGLGEMRLGEMRLGEMRPNPIKAMFTNTRFYEYSE